eukprot:457142-Amphidinium_carterae.1
MLQRVNFVLSESAIGESRIATRICKLSPPITLPQRGQWLEDGNGGGARRTFRPYSVLLMPYEPSFSCVGWVSSPESTRADQTSSARNAPQVAFH